MPRKRKTAPTQKRIIGAADRWRCSACGVWKHTGEYSEGQLKLVRDDVNLKPDNCFMSCVDCIDPPQKYQCEGKCGKMKPVAEFSKTSRKNQIWKCMECVSWDSLQEAYVPLLDKEDLMSMTLGVDAATAMAQGYEDEPTGHPEDSSWALSIAEASRKAGENTDNSTTDSARTNTSASPAPYHRGIPFNAYDGKGGPHRGWKVPTDTSVSTSQPSESEYTEVGSSCSSSKATSTGSSRAQSRWARSLGGGSIRD